MPDSMVTALLLALCPFAWFALDLLRKVLAGKGSVLAVTCWMVAAQAPLFGLWLAHSGMPSIGPGYWLPALLSMAINVVANLAYMRAVLLSPLSATIPLLSLTPAISTLIGIPLLGEIPTGAQWLGVVLVMVGAVLLNSDPRQDRTLPALLRSLAREKGSPWMVLVAVAWAATTPLDKVALGSASAAFHATFLVVGIATGLAIELGRRGEWSHLVQMRSAWPWLVAAALVSSLALAIQLEVIQRVWVGLIETLKRGVGSVLALAVGGAFLRETVAPRRKLAVGIMILGVCLVLL